MEGDNKNVILFDGGDGLFVRLLPIGFDWIIKYCEILSQSISVIEWFSFECRRIALLRNTIG